MLLSLSNNYWTSAYYLRSTFQYDPCSGAELDYSALINVLNVYSGLEKNVGTSAWCARKVARDGVAA